MSGIVPLGVGGKLGGMITTSSTLVFTGFPFRTCVKVTNLLRARAENALFSCIWSDYNTTWLANVL